MIFKESFVTKVNIDAVRSYLAHFYRSQDYRIEESQIKLVVVPYSFSAPFTPWKTAVNRVNMTYNFSQEEHKTIIDFSYKISFGGKIIAMALPLMALLAFYLIIKINLGAVHTLDGLLLGAFLIGLLAYSYTQAKNLTKHVVDKNKKLLKELEVFTDLHLHKGLLSESFKEA